MECIRYGVLARNRDNNGNGYIDPDEVRWYIGSLQQIYALYMGDLGMESDAQLYPTALASLPNSRVDGKWQWRNHIVCSNQTTITNAGQYVDKYWPGSWWGSHVILSCSYYSHGSLGGDLYYDDGITWFFQNKHVTISSTATSLRCVKDWPPCSNKV